MKINCFENHRLLCYCYLAVHTGNAVPAWQAFEREGKGSFRREGNARGARGGGGRTCVCITESLAWVAEVIVFGLGTGRYLSPVGGGAEEDFRGDHLIFGKTKGGNSRN